MIWLAFLASTYQAPAPADPAASVPDVRECEPPALDDMFGVRPINGAFIQVASKWAMPLCVDDAVLHPYWGADVASLGSGQSKHPVMHRISLDEVRMTSAWDVAEQVLRMERLPDALLRYELTRVGNCVTAKVASRRGPGGWEPATSVLDLTVQLPPAISFQQGRAALVAALVASRVGIDPDDDLPTGDRSCAIAGGVRAVRDVLADLLACSPAAGVPTFYLRTDGNGSWVLRFPVADPSIVSLPQPIVDEGRWQSPPLAPSRALGVHH